MVGEKVSDPVLGREPLPPADFEGNESSTSPRTRSGHARNFGIAQETTGLIRDTPEFETLRHV